MAKKVLIVDDDADIIELQKLYFEKEGYEVATCMQGDKAVATFNVSQAVSCKHFLSDTLKHISLLGVPTSSNESTGEINP